MEAKRKIFVPSSSNGRLSALTKKKIKKRILFFKKKKLFHSTNIMYKIYKVISSHLRLTGDFRRFKVGAICQQKIKDGINSPTTSTCPCSSSLSLCSWILFISSSANHIKTLPHDDPKISYIYIMQRISSCMPPLQKWRERDRTRSRQPSQLETIIMVIIKQDNKHYT